MKNLLIIIMCLAIVAFAIFYAHRQRLISDLETKVALKEAETARVQSEISAIIKRHEAEKAKWLKEQEKKPHKKIPSKGRVSDAELDRIVRAVCLVESDNRAHLGGSAGERGIMQIRYNEWRAGCKLLGVNWPWAEAFDKNKNIAVGTAYLGSLDKKYKSWETAVRVYHSGHHGVFVHGRGNRYLSMVRRVIETGNTKWRT